MRVHTDAGAANAARAIGARAFVQGNAIYFDRGEYAPESSAGRALLAHEIAHVAQVGMGTASATALHPAPAPTPAKPDTLSIQAKLIALMCRRSDTGAIVERIKADGVKIILFETAFDKWKYDDGHEEENELTGLQGNTCTVTGPFCPQAKVIRLRQSLNTEDMMMTLFHEMQHWQHSQDPKGPRGLDSEIEARVATEQLAIDRGKPETRKGYRTADGKPDRAAIEKEMKASPHYSPSGRERIGRRYVNETPLTGEWSCPPIGDFPDPGKFRNYA